MIQFFLTIMVIFAPMARGAVRMWSFAPIQILTLLILLLLMLKAFSDRKIVLRRTQLDVPIFLFLLISAIAFLNSKNLYSSMLEFTRLVSLIAIFYIVLNFIDTREKIKRLLNVILASSTAIALFGILQYLGIVDKSWWSNPRFLSATYVNHNHFAGFMELTIPLSIGMFLSERDLGKRFLYVYSFFILSTAFLLSMSRGGWLALSVSFIFMMLVMVKRNKSKNAFFILMFFFIIAALFVARIGGVDFLFRRLKSYLELDFSGRFQIWRGTLGIIKDHWLLGTGPGTFIYNFPRYRPVGLNTLVNYTHNDYLQIFSETGVIGAFLMVFIIWTIIKKGLATYRLAGSAFKTWISLSLSIGIMAMAIHGLGDFNFHIPANAILFTVFSALIFNIFSRREKIYPSLVIETRPIMHRVFKGAAVITIIILLVFISGSLAAEIYSTISDKALSVNDLKKAERTAITAVRLCPLSYAYQNKLAAIYYKKACKELDDTFYIKKSVDSYKHAISLNPLDAWSWLGLAEAYYELFKYSPLEETLLELSSSSYKKAVDLDPLNSYYLKKYARFLLDTGDVNLSSQIDKKISYVMSNTKAFSWMASKFTDGKSYLHP